MSRETSYDHCYRLLQLTPGASLAEIKQRYRDLARRSHPDTMPSAQREQATLQFQQINSAKETLEAYWEEHHCAPPTARQQRTQEAQSHRPPAPPPRTEYPRHLRPEQRRYQPSSRTSYDEQQRQQWNNQPNEGVPTKSSFSVLDRIFFVAAIEVVIGILLWLDYHVLLTLHRYLTEFQTDSASAVFLKVYLSVVFLALLFCGYVGGICLILLALAFLVFRHENVFAMLSARRKKPEDPFPHMTSPSPSRRKW
ncbi:MAG: hypothetical protein FJ147_11150 [Deltaproteobacteria bacterium]|nr:hypothetical protein [Deltaproteobacteria bacterium]